MRFHQRGSILVLALWSLSLLAVFSLSLGYGARQKVTLLSRLDGLDSLYSIAFSGVEKARAFLQREDATPGVETLLEAWAHSEPDFKKIKIAGGYCTVGYSDYDDENQVEIQWYGLVDEERKININTADASTLARLLAQLTELDEEEAQEVGYAIVDWRDQDSGFQHPRHGAEDDYYEDLRSPYQAKDAPFEVIEELLFVKGMTREIFDRIEPSVTIYGSGQVNINTASSKVLAALGLETDLIEKILLFRAGSDRLVQTTDDRSFANAGTLVSELGAVYAVDLVEEAALDQLVSRQMLGVASAHFRVRSQGVLPDKGSKLLLEAVIDRTGKIFYSRHSEIQWRSEG